MQSILFIKINFPNGIGENELPIPYILADTIESRKIGKIINEGTGDNFMNLAISLNKKKSSPCQEILSILKSLNLKNYSELSFKEG